MRQRRGAALAAVVALVGAVGAAHTASTPPVQESPAVVTLTGIDPVAGTPGGPLTVRGTVSDRGTRPLTSVRLQLWLGSSPVTSRAEMAQVAAATGRPEGQVVATTTPPAPGALQPGAATDFTLTVPSPDLGASGVYAMTVDVIADDADTGGRVRVGGSRTFLPWDMGAVQPTRLAVLWPVLATPSRDADGVPIDQLLQDEIDGRLGSVVTAGEGSRLTWLLDGDLLESAASLADGAPTGAGANAPKSTPDPVAAAWLQRLGAATATGQVLALPYADPDLVATVRAGLASDVATATVLGPADVGAVLGPAGTVPSPISWPAEGTATPATIKVVAETSGGPVVLSDAYSATVRDITSFTSSGVGPLIGTGLTAVVTDSVLSTLLATAPGSQGGAVAARQRMLAELAMVSEELPNQSRSVVMVPPRRWAPDAAYVQGLLQSLAAAPWVRMSTLGELTAGAASGPARQLPAYPATVRARELDTQQMSLVRTGHARLDALTAVLSQSQPFVDMYTRALLRGESTAWRTQRDAGLAYARSVVDRLDALTRSVRIVSSGPVTLAARSGKIPITIVNDLDQEATVRLGVAPVPAVRLSVTPPEPVVLQAHTQTTVDLAAQATANGNVLLVVRLLTLEGKTFGPATTLPVEITGYGAVAQWLVGGALVLLAVALAVRVARAVRGGRRPGSEASVRERVR